MAMLSEHDRQLQFEAKQKRIHALIAEDASVMTCTGFPCAATIKAYTRIVELETQVKKVQENNGKAIHNHQEPR